MTRVPGLLAGGDQFACIDVDDTGREVHGYAKQGSAHGYIGVRGLNIQIGTISTPLAAPVIGRARLRRGNANSATGASSLLAQTITTARAAGVTGQILGRAESAFYGWAFVGTAIRHRIWFSVTARMTSTVKTAIASIDPDAWETIQYHNAIWEDETAPGGAGSATAEVAEVEFTAFTSRRKHQHVTCRLIVRRVRRLQPLASDGSEQGELFAVHRHHAFITNSTLALVEADQRHRDHAIVEQVIAELKDGPLAHLPSGKDTANSAWVACAVIRVHLTRAPRGRRRHGHGGMGDPAPQDHQHPRPDRRHRPTPRPAPTQLLALGTLMGNAARHRDRTTVSRRDPTTQPTGRYRDREVEEPAPAGGPSTPSLRPPIAFRQPAIHRPARRIRAEVKLGIPPGIGGTQRLTRAVGKGQGDGDVPDGPPHGRP